MLRNLLFSKNLNSQLSDPYYIYNQAFNECSSELQNLFELKEENQINAWSFELEPNKKICLIGNAILAANDTFHGVTKLVIPKNENEWQFDSNVTDIDNPLFVLTKIPEDYNSPATYDKPPITLLSCSEGKSCKIQALQLTQSYYTTITTKPGKIHQAHRVRVTTKSSGVGNNDKKIIQPTVFTEDATTMYDTYHILSKETRSYSYKKFTNDMELTIMPDEDTEPLEGKLNLANSSFAATGTFRDLENPKSTYCTISYQTIGIGEAEWFFPEVDVTLSSKGGVYTIETADVPFPVTPQPPKPPIDYDQAFSDCTSSLGNIVYQTNLSDPVLEKTIEAGKKLCVVGNIMISSDEQFTARPAYPKENSFEYGTETANPLLVLMKIGINAYPNEHIEEYPISLIKCADAAKSCTIHTKGIPVSYYNELKLSGKSVKGGAKVIINTKTEGNQTIQSRFNFTDDEIVGVTSHAVFLNKETRTFEYSRDEACEFAAYPTADTTKLSGSLSTSSYYSLVSNCYPNYTQNQVYDINVTFAKAKTLNDDKWFFPEDLEITIPAAGGIFTKENADQTYPLDPPTPTPLPTPTVEPTATPGPEPTATPGPEPTATPGPEPTATPGPEPTATPGPEPTATPGPEPTSGPKPTSGPEPTSGPKPTSGPEPTAGPEPTTAEPTPKPEPTPNNQKKRTIIIASAAAGGAVALIIIIVVVVCVIKRRKGDSFESILDTSGLLTGI